MPGAVLSAENTAGNHLSPQGANIEWGLHTDKSIMTQQREMCPQESTRDWESTEHPTQSSMVRKTSPLCANLLDLMDHPGPLVGDHCPREY